MNSKSYFTWPNCYLNANFNRFTVLLLIFIYTYIYFTALQQYLSVCLHGHIMCQRLLLHYIGTIHNLQQLHNIKYMKIGVNCNPLSHTLTFCVHNVVRTCWACAILHTVDHHRHMHLDAHHTTYLYRLAIQAHDYDPQESVAACGLILLNHVDINFSQYCLF